MKAFPSSSEGGDVPNGMSKGGEKADRRGRLSLLCGNSFNGRSSLTPSPSPNGEGSKYYY
ncbi:hypothetical protein HMPREF0973_02314 [Prevotella veroralis F0319]|uniref:Uncharacterized protein n=1 Tax=Prevotella veroralis F0319 TaxID=649761 RepID=C9MRQ1_9BACT|nr:hypothetical protein HMPREF0973_02314 [Prevotella veroralis F0319]